MKIRAIAVGVLMASFCTVVHSTNGSQHNFLKSGGVDDASVADTYYGTIDPHNLRLTQTAWMEVNGFNDPLNEIIDARGYFNESDLAFWRSISMVVDKRAGHEGNIAFTTGNYNTEQDALDGTNPVSIVNMEYSSGPEGDRISKFYVFDANNGQRLTSTAFDSRNEQLFLPAACYSCHGGDDDAVAPLSGGYNDGSGETNSSFLALDINTMSFGGTTQASLEAAFKAMNEAILHTDPTKATKKLVKGLYGGSDFPRDTQDTAYIPTSWQTEPALYSDVIVSTCRGCHTVADSKILSLEWWKANPDKIREVVFHEQTMPNSMPAYNRFWTTTQSQILLDAINRFEFP